MLIDVLSLQRKDCSSPRRVTDDRQPLGGGGGKSVSEKKRRDIRRQR